MESISIHEKYASRPASLEHMCLAQFAICFDTVPLKSVKAKVFDEGVCNEDTSRESQKIVSWDKQLESELPTHIMLNNNVGYMRLRGNQAILRYHKFKEDKNFEEYLYSQLLLYKPWRSEVNDLKLGDLHAIVELFRKEQKKIETIEANLFPHRKSVNEARAVLENFPDSRPSHIGDELDPENEKDNQESTVEGLAEDEEYAARFPDEQLNDLEGGPSSANARPSFNQADVPRTGPEREAMRKAVRELDPDQRFLLDIYVEFTKALIASQNSTMKTPSAPLLNVQGGAGAGKSTVIDVITRLLNIGWIMARITVWLNQL